MKNFKTLGTALVAVFLMAGSASAQLLKAAKTQDNFSVKYTGTEANYLLFEVAILEAGEGNSILKISDRAEGELYTQNWKPKTTTQIFKIEKQDGQQLIFNLQVGDKEYTKTFSATTRMIEKTTVQENGFVIL
ncbi:MAG: hypothetical protein LH615_01310 [Ferruginibacter sp.]|nr:hypothetical protein [Ferruginibacter sp.]